MVKIAKGATLDRSLIFDFQTAKILSIATDLNDDKTAFYSSIQLAESSNSDAYKELTKYTTASFGINETELKWGKRDKEIAFVDIAEISDLNSWEVFSLKKYFDTESYLDILREDIMELAWFMNTNSFAIAYRCKLFQGVCRRYEKILFERTVKETFEKNAKSFYISLYNAAKVIDIRAKKFNHDYFYILNRFDIITLQSIGNEMVRDFEGRFKNTQVEAFIAKDLFAKVRRFYYQ